MNLDDRNLSKGMQGEDVKLLQRELRQLGSVIADAEVAKSLFGETTRRAVIDFQKSRGLTADGIVGVNTAKELSVAIAGLQDPKRGDPKKSEPGKSEFQPPSANATKLPPNGEPKPPKDIPPSSYVIQGQLSQMDEKPAVGLMVRAFNKDASGSETKLGESVSDQDGRYQITYLEVLFSKFSSGRNGLDMVLRIFDQTHNMNQGWNAVHVTKPVEILEPRWVSWLPWKEPETTPFSVAGNVLWSNGQPAANLTVRAFDKDLRSEEELGKTVTDNQGHYQINYSASQFVRHEKGSADLVIRVSDGAGTLPVCSPIIFNAQPLETVDLSFGAESRPPSEYEMMIKALTPLLQSVPLSELVENEEHTDISFLAGESGFDPQRILWLVQAATLERDTKSIPAEVFYGLFRQKLPTDLGDLLGLVSQALRRSLEQSVLDNVIPSLSSAELDQIVNKLQSLRADLMLKPADNNQQLSLGDLLNTTQMTADKKRIIAELQLEHDGASESFWKALNERREFDEKEIKAVRLTLQLGVLTGSHLPLIIALQRIASTDPATAQTNGFPSSELRPFARLDVADWKALLQQPQPNGQPIGTPPVTPGDNPQDRTNNYAIALNQYIENLLPTTVIASRLEKDLSDDSPFKSAQVDLKTFFSNNPSFEFRDLPVGRYLSEGREQKLLNVRDPAELTKQLKGMGRIFNITPRYPEMRALLADDLHSAQAIVSVGKRRFTEKYGTPLGGPDKAREVYKTAERVHATALNLCMKHAVAFNSPTPYVISGGTTATPVTTESKTFLQFGPQASANLSNLFGSLDVCDCERCLSLYSPAAYFVDILKFLADGPVKDEMNPLQTLLTRRPDLEHIELTCENTNTQIPYVDLVNEILEAAIEPRSFHIAEGPDVDSVVMDLDSGTTPLGFKQSFASHGYPISDGASVRIDSKTRVNVRWSWIILDGAWAFTLKRMGTNEGFQVFAWPQTSWNSEELRANPEHLQDRAIGILRGAGAVYPWNLPLDIPLEEMRAYLSHLGVKRHEVMETFFGSAAVDPLVDSNIAFEYLGLSREEADIVKGVTAGDPSTATPTDAWSFWGLRNTGNEIADLTDETATPALGDWDLVLRRVSIFLQQSGLSYKELLELLGMYFINPATSDGRTIGIVSIDPVDAATCKLSQLEIQVVDSSISNQRAELIAAWDRIHRFVRLWRKLGWTMRDLDRAITALTPIDAIREITHPFLVKLSHIQRLRACLNVPLVNMLSWFADIDTASYIDHLAEGQPKVTSLYTQLFRNQSVIKPLDEGFTEDAHALSGTISLHFPTLVAALGISAADLSLLTTDTAIVSGDNLNLVNLSHLYRVVSLAKALKLTIREYQSIRTLSGIDSFTGTSAPSPAPAIPATRSTLRFVETVELVRASGFSINELDYLLRHDFTSESGVAPPEDDIAATLDEIRSELQKIAAENTVREEPDYQNGLTTDTDGVLTRSKLALLNWDTALIEQLVATLNDSVTYESLTVTVLTGLTLPNDPGSYEVNLASLPIGFSFPDQLSQVVRSAASFLFACDSAIPVESAPGIISTALRNQFSGHAIALGASTPVTTETPGTAWTINGRYSVVKNEAILNVYDLNDKKLRASRLLSKPERILLTNLAADSLVSGFIDASARLLELQDQLQGEISYDQVMVNGQLKGRLRFKGLMTNARKTLLDSVSSVPAYRDAVQELYEGPRNFIARYAGNFSIMNFETNLAALPASVRFPNALKNKAYFDAAVEPKKLHFIGVMTKQQRDALLSLSTSLSDAAHRPFVDAVNHLFTQPDALAQTFLTGPGPGTDAARLFDDPMAPEERFLLLLKKLLPQLRETLSRRLVIEKMAGALNLEAMTAAELITTLVSSPAHSTRKSIAEFLAPNFAESNLNKKLSATVFPDQFKTFTLLHKIGVLTTKFKITPDQLPWLFNHRPEAGWLNFNALPMVATVSPAALFAGWRKLVGMFRLRDKLPIDALAMFDLFDEAIAAVPANLSLAKERYFEKLSQLTKWSIEEMETLLGRRNQPRERGVLRCAFPDDYKDERMLVRLHVCFQALKRIGASAKQLSDWARTDQTISEELNNARNVKNTVKAKYDDTQWPAVAKPLRDPLREKQRSALVSYLVAQRGMRDASELYEYFLIDVEMSPCMMTTRIKQAISSVQLFIQRSLMNLETDVSMTPNEAREWSQWRKWYRVWEANRKVLLYPENWIEPELRDDKSPFFQELENELLQSDVTMETAEDAFLHYLEKLDQVARLEIVGMYHQQEPGDKARQLEGVDILHVFGRTLAIPHLYFYRRAYRRPEGDVWSAWEKVDLDIEGDHLIPVAWNRRLYLFWAIFTEKSEQPTRDQRSRDEDPRKYWEIKFGWSEYKNYQWSPKKVSKQWLRSNKDPLSVNPSIVAQEPQDFSFKSRIVQSLLGEQLSLECYGTTVVPPAPLSSPDPRIFAASYHIRIDTGSRETWGAIWINLVMENGSRKVIYFKDSVNHASGVLVPDTDPNRHPELHSLIFQPNSSKSTTTAINGNQITGIGIDLRDVRRVEVEWAESNINDAWAFQGISIDAITSSGQTIPILIEGLSFFSKLPYIELFFNGLGEGNRARHLVWTNTGRIGDRPVLVPMQLPPTPHRMQGIGEFTLDDCHGDLVANAAGSPPEKFVTLLKMPSPPSHQYRIEFTKHGGSPLGPADIADIKVLRRRQDEGITLQTIRLNPAGNTPDATLFDNSDFYLVSQRFSSSSVSSLLPLLGSSLGEIVTVDLRSASRPITAATASIIPLQLEPLPGTEIQSMMMVDLNAFDGLGPSAVLEKTPGTFRLLGAHQTYIPSYISLPFFYQDELHTYAVSRTPATSRQPAKNRFSVFYHPMVCDFIKSLNRRGIEGLLTLANQRLTDNAEAFSKYLPDESKVDPRVPKEDVDFTHEGAYSNYNWELFFHTPFLIAMQLSKNQRFEEAQKWFHYIFDPTATDSPERPASPGPERFWRVKPFYDEAMRGVQTLDGLIADTEEMDRQISYWQANPFKPHVIARIRFVAYMKAVVMRYIDNLIAWGDQLFRRDTIESINEATQLYILAGQILGRRPEGIPARAKAKIQTFRTLDDVATLDGLSNAMVEIESFLAPSFVPPSATESHGAPPFTMRYFGIPGNDKLLGYWDTVADRLFKIRHCLNIEGVERALPMFEPPIDPALLVRAAAAGVDIASALNDINAPVPHYRFNVMMQKASELCNDVKALGGALLSALEKRDAETLALLRSSHEVELLKAIREIKTQQIDEASNTLAGLMKYEEVVTTRQQYYLSRPFMNSFEMGHLDLVGSSLILMSAQLGAEVLAGVLHLIPGIKMGAPTTIGATYGGDNVGPAAQAFGSAAGTTASMLNTIGSLSATLGGYQRRQDDWTHQAELAKKELKQVQKQIAAAEIRLAISEHELQNHDSQIENAKEVDAYMRAQKFTNQELYSWMVGKLSGIYFQSYQLAYDVAKRAERAYRYELGFRDSNFIQFGYWDSLKKGLLSGERLHQDLKRMDVAYLDQNKREYEITKHISLLAIDPTSFVTLKETGECQVTLPEALFDIDYPGHYMRRIKSISITVPCVTGPYAGVNCTLTQLNSSIRHANTALGAYARRDEDTRFSDSFGAIQSIVTSHGQGDGGLFETNLRDERYLPFEGAGVISTWRIELPSVLATFDYSTISDVVLHVRYTARDGGRNLKQRVTGELTAALNLIEESARGKGLARLFSLRQEFPTEWHRLISGTNGNGAGALPHFFVITKNRFPFLFTQKDIRISAVELYAVPKSDIAINEFPTLDIKLPMATSVVPMEEGVRIGNLLAKTLTLGTELTVDPEEGNAQWEFQIPQGRLVNFQQEINDILMVCHYSI